jgi:hypothetical protein
MAQRQESAPKASGGDGFKPGDPNRVVSVRNRDVMTLKLRLDPEAAQRARDENVVGICYDADVWILGAAVNKKHADDVPPEIEVPGYVWDAVRAWDPPASRSGSNGAVNAYQRKLLQGYENRGQIQITGA